MHEIIGINERQPLPFRMRRTNIPGTGRAKALVILCPDHGCRWMIASDPIAGAIRAIVIDHDHFQRRLCQHFRQALLQVMQTSFAGRDDREAGAHGLA